MFWRRGIRYKLAIALWGVAIIAFAAAGLALVLFENLTLERRVGQIMEPYAQLVSVGTEAAVAFEDPGRAQEILNTLRTNPQLSKAEIFLRDGRLLARYSGRSKEASLPPSLKPDGVYLNHNNAELLQSLQDGAHLRLVMSLNELNRQTQEILWKFALGMFVLLVTITLALRAALQKTIIDPISTLVKTVEQVRTRADYSRRVPASGVDEVGRLGQSFNAMMGVIQEREGDLRRLTLFQRTILDNAAYGIISTTTEGIVSSFNRAAEHLLGYPAEEVVGKLTPVCWHDQEEISRRALQLSEELGETVAPGFEVFAVRLRRNLPEENEWTYIRKDGTRMPVLLSVTALQGASGQITGFVGLAYDLTERKQAEARYRALFENAVDGIFQTTPSGRFIDANPALARMLGYTSARELMACVTDIPQQLYAWPEHRAEISHLMEERGVVEAFETRLYRKDGSSIWVSVNGRAVCNGSGAILYWEGITEDITERKKAEEELNRYKTHLETLVQERTVQLEQANVRLQEMDRLKSMFIASTSHELRTPLNAIIGFTGMTLQGLSGELNEEQHDNLARVYRSAKHLLALITDIIDISKIEAGKISIFPEEFPLEELVDEAIAIVTPQLQKKGLSLERELPATLNMYADRKRLFQCLVNLLSNAAKFTEKGRIIVAARENDGSIELSVTDSGIGIAERDLPRLFKPFERLESHLRVRAGGTGLGLYLTAKLVADILRGTISVQSREGEGSTFTLSLPRDLRRVPEPPDLVREGGGTP
ncbi:MAG TPA: hypothetical protein DCZ75_08785 [Geobacter sp.]|nr:hypothetical protein [Geobacter sp.]